MLEDVLKRAEVESWKHARLEYHSAIPLYANGGDIPPPPAPPEWLADLMDD